MQEVREVKVVDLHPGLNYRKTFEKGSIAELAQSIQQKGILQPLLIRKNDKGFNIIAGERRWRAAVALKMETVPCIEKEATDEEAMELSIIENAQREDPNVMEEAEGFKTLLDMGKHTPETLAEKLGKNHKYVLGRVRLLTLHKDVQKALANDTIEYGHALYISRLKNKDEQKELLQQVLENNMSVADTADEIGQFATRLANAKFDKGDCQACPSRNQNQKALFPEAVKDTDACLDKTCYMKKLREYFTMMKTTLEKAGVKVWTTQLEAEDAMKGAGFRLETDPEMYGYPRKYKSMCSKCETKQYFIYETKYAGGGSTFNHGEICTSKKCYNEMQGLKKADVSADGAVTKNLQPTASRQYAVDMRNRFLCENIPGAVSSSETLCRRFTIFHLLSAFNKLTYGQSAHLEVSYDEAMSEIIKEFYPKWKPNHYLEEAKLFAIIQQIPARKLAEMIVKVTDAMTVYTKQEVLLQAMDEAGLKWEKHFSVDEEYLSHQQKPLLLAFAKKFKLDAPALNEDMKKDEMIAAILKNKLVGLVPQDIAKESKPYEIK